MSSMGRYLVIQNSFVRGHVISGQVRTLVIAVLLYCRYHLISEPQTGYTTKTGLSAHVRITRVNGRPPRY